jgi:hypothetical protein
MQLTGRGEPVHLVEVEPADLVGFQPRGAVTSTAAGATATIVE